MGWFDDQIEYRKKRERQLLSDSFENIARSITGGQIGSIFDENADMTGAKYKASLVVDDSKLAEKIDKGLIDATSIGFTFEPECSICGNPYYSEECGHNP